MPRGPKKGLNLSDTWLARAWHRHCEAGWTAWLRLGLAMLVGGIAWRTGQCFAILAAGAMVFLHLVTYAIVGLEVTGDETEISKATYDGVNLSVHVLVVAIAAVLGLSVTLGKPAGGVGVWVRLAGAFGVGLGIWALMLLAEPSSQQGTKVKVKKLRWGLVRFFWWIQLFSLFILIGFLVV